uniref:Uncharacterized protein n=1 Tax=Moniliophthora roreri TaxID=221103 RepID=A0A0W0FR78_MONRR
MSQSLATRVSNYIHSGIYEWIAVSVPSLYSISHSSILTSVEA